MLKPRQSVPKTMYIVSSDSKVPTTTFTQPKDRLVSKPLQGPEGPNVENTGGEQLATGNTCYVPSEARNHLKISLTQIKPYSQSWNKTEAPPTSPRLSRRKPRMNSYSAQSWLDNEKSTVSHRRPMRTVSSQQSQPIPNRCPHRRTPSQFGVERRSNRQPPVQRPDPSAPHLKYGLFANPRKPVIYGGLSKTISSKQIPKKKPTTEVSVRNVRRERQREPKEETKYEETDQHQSDVPLLVFRPLSHRYTQKLSASDVHHLDIRPGRRPGSPQLPRAIIVK